MPRVWLHYDAGKRLLALPPLWMQLLRVALDNMIGLRIMADTVPRIALSADEVAEMLSISRAHVWKLLSSGRLPRPVRLGRSVRWSRTTLEAWMEAGAPPVDRWQGTRSYKNA